ncbi:LamG [Parelaphostrongylus tenuis]|uniref:LamG n=1 Tax=Parelaphostrongylus tenuis TaxID=148309 RepID=A0AAD5R7I5_PARTN|nr:LamG [Parelaphostrongylus tenuis]
MSGEQILHVFPYIFESEAETIEIRFKTEYSDGVLLNTRSNSDPNNELLIFLRDGSLEVLLRHNAAEHRFKWGHGISDNRWHFMRLKRRGEKVLLYLNGKWQQNNFLPSSMVLKINEISCGVGFTRSNGNLTQPFRGTLSRMMFNDIDLLERRKREGKLNKESKNQRNIKLKNSSVSFVNTSGYAVLSKRMASPFRLIYPSIFLQRAA